MPAPARIPKEQMEKMVLIGIGVAVVIFVLIGFVTVPLTGKIGKLNKEIIKERDDLKRAEILIKSKTQLESRFEALNEKLGEYEKALPPHTEMPNILQEIAGLASETKVKISKIEPLRTEKQPENVKPAKKVAGKQPVEQDTSKKPKTIYTEMPIQVEARGGYHALGEFINRLETADNIISIGDIEIRANSDDIYNHSATLLIVAFVLKEEAPTR